MRRLDAWEALALSLIGLGYLYVGRIGTAIAAIVAGLAVLAVLGWTRWIFEPWGAWVLLGAAGIFLLFHLLHPALIARQQKAAPTRPYNRWYFYAGWVVGLSLLGEAFVQNKDRLLGYEIYRIPGEAMMPTLHPGDWVTADTWWYDSREPRAGEMLAYGDSEGRVFAKRLVGVPGDTIEIRQGALYRNRQPVHEPYLHAQLPDRTSGRDVPTVELGPGEYYVLGDFRDNSRDSRQLGPINRQQLIARLQTIGFSIAGSRVNWDRFPSRLADDT